MRKPCPRITPHELTGLHRAAKTDCWLHLREGGEYPRPVWRTLLILLFAFTSMAVLFMQPLPASAAIFEDGNDRQLLYELRMKADASLTAQERMVLHAADRYGNVGFCAGSSGNATLIDYFGRPAIITSAHILFHNKNGNAPKCSPSELAGSFYMPNVSYVGGDGRFSDAFAMRRVKLVMPDQALRNPVYLDGIGSGNNDFAIFFLEEDITIDIMPAGHQRGAIRLPDPLLGRQGSGEATMIGVAPDVQEGRAVLYQTCRYNVILIVGLRHLCDTVSGSSGSFFGVVQDDELRLLGIHTGDYQDGAVLPVPDSVALANVGTYLGNIPPLDEVSDADRVSRRYVSLFRDPAYIPYQIQFLLSRAGCYTGKLDNKWGPGSRAALERFSAATGMSLPSVEPSQDLWDVLEELIAARAGGCQ